MARGAQFTRSRSRRARDASSGLRAARCCWMRSATSARVLGKASAARAAGGRSAAGWRLRAAANQRARGSGNQQLAAGQGCGRPLSRGPVFPAQRHSDPASAVRERREDILALARNFLVRMAAEAGRHMTLDPEAAEMLLRHLWPGNVRELENAIERAVVLTRSDAITAADLMISSSSTIKRNKIKVK